jgi:hypothetical protein
MAVRTDLLAQGTVASVSKVCEVLQVPRSTAYYQPTRPETKPEMDEGLAFQIRSIIERFPTFGIRRVWAWLKNRMGVKANRKKVARLMRLKGWTVKQRRAGMRPRVAITKSITDRPDQRWSTDIALVLVRLHARGGLLHPRAPGMGAEPDFALQSGGEGIGVRPDRALRLDPRGAAGTDAEKR